MSGRKLCALAMALVTCSASTFPAAAYGIDGGVARNVVAKEASGAGEARASADSEAPLTGADVAASFDKAEFYAEEDDPVLLPYASHAASVYPMTMSDELKYFGSFESGNYDQGFSYGDGYHALGYYQFDHRYGLQDFLVACYNYDSRTYAMLAWLTSDVDLTVETMYDNAAGALTEMGCRVEDSWHAAYAANPQNFSALQDGWQYETYCAPAIRYLESRGLQMAERRDCIKGLCGGLYSLFGSGGWRRFVGGQFAGVNYAGAGLNNTMSDGEFAATLCNYVVDNVELFYPSQQQYHQGWQNRYRAELEACLGFLAYPSDIDHSAWYAASYDFVTERDIMKGYSDGRFGPYDSITRGQVVTILWRCVGEPVMGALPFYDVPAGEYYSRAIAWAASEGLAAGCGDGSFAPDKPVTREELAVFLQRFAVWKNPSLASFDSNSLSGFPDASKVSPFAVSALSWCVDRGLISGVAGMLEPQDGAWRASMAAMMTTLYRNYAL